MKIGDIGADQQGRVEGNNREAAATEFFDGLSKMNVLMFGEREDQFSSILVSDIVLARHATGNRV